MIVITLFFCKKANGLILVIHKHNAGVHGCICYSMPISYMHNYVPVYKNFLSGCT